MSAIAIPTPRIPAGGQLWRSQTAAILGVELRKNFITKRGFWIYLLALAPAAIIWLHSFVTMRSADVADHGSLERHRDPGRHLPDIFLRPAVYFGCVGIFTYLFRGEVVERTLALLLPVADSPGSADGWQVFSWIDHRRHSSSVEASRLAFAGMYAHYPGHEIRAYLFDGPGFGHLLAYVGITALGVHGVWRAVPLAGDSL